MGAGRLDRRSPLSPAQISPPKHPTPPIMEANGTDSDSPIAVVGGLLLRFKDFTWLDVEWRKVQSKHGITHPIHMREFGPDGDFAETSADARRRLFADLVSVINEHKVASVAVTLDAEKYRRVFTGITNLSMYGACFAQLAIINDVYARKNDYHEPIPYVLNDGNSGKSHIAEAKRALALPSVKTIEFCSDTFLCALQAADVVSWSVRRRLAGQFPSGLEPLQGLFNEHHLDLEYNEELMVGVADSIRNAGGSETNR
jgi:hypothetical protein